MEAYSKMGDFQEPLHQEDVYDRPYFRTAPKNKSALKKLIEPNYAYHN